MTAAPKSMQEEVLNRKAAAEQFAAKIRELAESGSIETLSITIHAWSSDELFKLAQSLGIKELSITAQFGVSGFFRWAGESIKSIVWPV